MEKIDFKIGAVAAIAVLMIGLGIGYTLNADGPSGDDLVYQYATIGSLMQGIYDGYLTVGEAKEQGDFGLGTFNSLDGEMVELDGIVYKVSYDGTVQVMDDGELTPFVYVTHFDEDITVEIPGPMGLEELGEWMEGQMPSENLIYAVKVDGDFSSMKTRSPRPQSRPYPDLIEALSDQSIFQFEDISGTLVGFWNPSYVEGVNVVGYHLHFISDARDSGGHVLDLEVLTGTLYLDLCYELRVDMPSEGEFLLIDLEDGHEGVEKVEK